MTYTLEWSSFMGLEEDQALRSIFCYPNPFSDEIHISMEIESVGRVEIGIYDMLGRKVFAQSFESSELPEVITINPSLQSGVYVLRIGNRTLKIVRL